LTPFILPDHGHCPTYLFFFSFFIFLFSLRLFCGAFLPSFTPLLFSFITPSSFQSFYILVLRFISEKSCEAFFSINLLRVYQKYRPLSTHLIGQFGRCEWMKNFKEFPERRDSAMLYTILRKVLFFSKKFINCKK
jgi:hypothetical protein